MISTDVTLLYFICSMINAAVLLYGGITDLKRREIPNIVPIILILTGFAEYRLVTIRIAGMFFSMAILFLSVLLSGHEVPGGDFKLICAMTLSCGVAVTAMTLFLAGLGAVAVGGIQKKPIGRHIPLCSYVAPAYLLACTIFFGNLAYFSSFLLICVVLLCIAKGSIIKTEEIKHSTKEETK